MQALLACLFYLEVLWDLRARNLALLTQLGETIPEVPQTGGVVEQTIQPSAGRYHADLC